MLLRFADLLVELGFGAAVAIAAGLGGELGVHRCVLVGLALDGQLQAAAEDRLLLVVGEGPSVVHHQLRVHQAEMGESMLCFLIGGVAEQPGQLAVAKLLGHLCKKQVFAVSHALAAESGFEVGLGAGLGEIHGL